MFLAEYYMLYSILLFLVGYTIFVEYQDGSLAIFFWITILLIYVLPAYADPFLSNVTVDHSFRFLDLRNNPVLLKSHLFAILFTLCYLLTRNSWTTKRNLKYQYNIVRDIHQACLSFQYTTMLLQLISVIAVMGLLAAVIALIAKGGVALLLESGFQKFREGTDVNLMRISIYFIVMACGGAFIAFALKKRVYLILIPTVVIIYFLLTTSRTIVGYAAIPFVAYAIYRYRSLKARLLFILAIPVLNILLILLLFLRAEGSMGMCIDAIAKGRVNSSYLTELLSHNGEAQLRYVYYFFLDDDYDKNAFITGQTYLRLLLMPFPPENTLVKKPEIIEHTMSTIFFEKNRGIRDDPFSALPALFYGDAYVSFGWAGILLGCMWGMIISGWNNIQYKLPLGVRLIMIGPVSIGAIKAARGSIFSSLSVIVVSFVLAFACNGLIELAKFNVGQRKTGGAFQGAPAATGRRNIFRKI